MTTNTTKLAEAIGLLSTVLSSEIAQTNNPFETDDVEAVALDDYNDLKDIADTFNDEASNALDGIRGEIDSCLEWESDDPLTQDFREKMWDDDEETEDETAEEEETPAEEENADESKVIEEAIEAATSKITDLELTNAKLKATLESVAESVNDLLVLNESFEEDLAQY